MKDPAGTREVVAWLEALGGRTWGAPAETFSYGPSPEQRAEFWPAPNRLTSHAVVSIHGGAFMAGIDLTSHHPFCSALQGRGFDVYNVEYRRTGSVLRPEDSLADARAAVEAVVARADGEVAVVGHSAGGYLAESVADLPGVAVTVAMAPLTDLWRWGQETSPDRLMAWLAGPEEASAADAGRLSLDPERRVSASRSLIHGTDDAVVPFAISQEYVSRVLDTGQAIHFDVLEGEGHFAFIDPDEPACRQVMSALERWRGTAD
jgi:acetyl esterase/lipase